MKITLHQGDIPANLSFGTSVAIDTETMGLNHARDRLCLIQLSSGDGNVHLVQFKKGEFDAPNLRKLLSDKSVLKIFHYARFDVAAIYKSFGIMVESVYCTKIAARLACPCLHSFSLKSLCLDLLGVELEKQTQSSDWGAEVLSEEQQRYAATDVLYLHQLKEKIDIILQREGREGLAKACFSFVPVRSVLDNAGWEDVDIFAHH